MFASCYDCTYANCTYEASRQNAVTKHEGVPLLTGHVQSRNQPDGIGSDLLHACQRQRSQPTEKPQTTKATGVDAVIKAISAEEQDYCETGKGNMPAQGSWRHRPWDALLPFDSDLGPQPEVL